MIDDAEKQGKWLNCHYQNLWFSPNELRDLQLRGSFRWGPVNWEIRDPKERLEQLERGIKSATKERDDFINHLIKLKATGE